MNNRVTKKRKLKLIIVICERSSNDIPSQLTLKMKVDERKNFLFFISELNMLIL